MNPLELVGALTREVERQLPGVVIPPQALHSLLSAAHFIVEERKPMKGSFTPVKPDEDLVLDRVPGWEAA
jgi:hypothetical protein